MTETTFKHTFLCQRCKRVTVSTLCGCPEPDPVEVAVTVVSGDTRGSFAYEPNDPKHPTYHERMVDIWDNRDKFERHD